MATTKMVPTVGSWPAKFVSKRRTRTRPSGLPLHRQPYYANHIFGHPEKTEDFMLYNEADDDEEDDDDFDEEENAHDGGGYIALRGVPHHPSHPHNHQPPKRRQPFNQMYQPLSYNFVDYVIARSRGLGQLEYQKVNEEFGTRHTLTTGMFKEHPIPLNRINKVFCSQWLNDHQIVFGTKCNKLMVYDINNRQMDHIPSLRSSEQPRPPDQQCGIHAIELNPSGTLLATGAHNSHDIAVYRLPTLDPVCVGEKAHSDWIFDMSWLDDQFLVSGSRDCKLALWRIEDEDISNGDSEGLPNYSYMNPVMVRKCKAAEKVRTVLFNPKLTEIVAVSLNAFIHVWDANRFTQKMSRKLPHALENVCLTKREDCSLYAIGSKSHTSLLDPRTLQHVRKVHARVTGCGIRSVSFHGDILTIGTGIGTIMFYDMRNGKYLESTMNSGRAVLLKCTNGWVSLDDDAYHDGMHPNLEHTAAIYTHCYDWSGTRLFAAGGPLHASLKGNYAALWC